MKSLSVGKRLQQAKEADLVRSSSQLNETEELTLVGEKATEKQRKEDDQCSDEIKHGEAGASRVEPTTALQTTATPLCYGARKGEDRTHEPVDGIAFKTTAKTSKRLPGMPDNEQLIESVVSCWRLCAHSRDWKCSAEDQPWKGTFWP